MANVRFINGFVKLMMLKWFLAFIYYGYRVWVIVMNGMNAGHRKCITNSRLCMPDLE